LLHRFRAEGDAVQVGKVSRWVAAATIACSLSACSGEEPVRKASPEQTQPVNVVPAGPATGDLFLVGTVTANGEPLPGARVYLSLTPEDDDTAPGTKVDSWQSEPDMTNADGRFSISIDPDQPPARYWPTSRNFLNFELMVGADGELATWGSTLWLLPDELVWRTQQAGLDDRVMDVSLDMAEETIEVTDSEGNTESAELAVTPIPGTKVD
jgi:hypothetical protein